MIDRKLIKNIINYSKLRKSDVILEIGPGKGFLTKELVKRCKVIAIEKDKSFEKELKKLSKLYNKNLKIIFGNILNLINSVKFKKIISNIPYSISEPLILKILRTPPDLVVLTVSKGFSQKLISKNSKIGMIAGLFFDIELKEEVKPKSFVPRPKTDSAVIVMTPREEESFSIYEIVLRQFILLNEKKVKNALMEALIKGLELTKKKARDLINKMDLKKEILNKNAGVISFAEFKKINDKLVKSLNEYNKAKSNCY